MLDGPYKPARHRVQRREGGGERGRDSGNIENSDGFATIYCAALMVLFSQICGTHCIYVCKSALRQGKTSYNNL